MNDDLFDLHVGYVSFNNPIAIAPMAGITGSDFANKNAGKAGLVVIGGYNLDERTNEAASQMASRGREEFVSKDPLGYIQSEIDSTDIEGAVAINVRSTTLEPLLKAAEIAKHAKAILELDAHCRQEEMTGIGVGQALLRDIPRLVDWIKRIKETGVVLSIKIRANVVDDVALARAIDAAGADILHVDAMIPGAGADLDTVRRIRDSTRMFIIGNNSIKDFSDAKDMFSRGSDMVSVGRAAMENPGIIDHLVDSVTQFQVQTGWYNSPKHVCSGKGDLRGLSFCCLPVKPCAVHHKINDLGLSAQEFADLKVEFAKGTMLEYGDSTCFGSLVWCCKLSKPCYIRNGVMDVLGLSGAEYMRLKKELADYILDKAKKPVNES